MPKHVDFDIDEWKSGIAMEIESSISEKITSQYEFDNLTLVDRSRIQHVLDELDFQSTQYISDETRIKIGKLTGATHLLIVEASRFRESRGFLDATSRRLVDVKTGEVLASSIIRVHKSKSGRVRYIE